MADVSNTIITEDGVRLDRAVLENALRPLTKYFIPKRRLYIREKQKPLGRGGYGVVKLAELISNDQSSGSVMVAVKVLQTDDETALPLRVAYRLTREMLAWSACHHENILPFVGYFLSQDLETAYLVSPFIRNGNVKDYLRSKEAEQEERLELVRDTLKGLQYLHTRDPPIVHGDLKSLNVLVNDDRRAVLCDFGLAGAVRREGHSGLTTSSHFKGSARWCSPEVLLGDKRTLKSDIWGWACLALEIMTGNPPCYDITNEARLILVLCGDAPKRKTPEPAPAPNFPNGLLELLRKCWEFEPGDRPDVYTCAAAIIPVPQTESASLKPRSTQT